MSDWIAVRSRFGFDASTLKRDALIFDRIAVPNDPSLIPSVNNDNPLDIPKWLYDDEILFEPSFEHSADEEFIRFFDLAGDRSYSAANVLAKNERLNRIVRNTIQLPQERWPGVIEALSDDASGEIVSTINEIVEQYSLCGDFRARAMSIQLRQNGLDAYPLLTSDLGAGRGTATDKSSIIEVVLNSLPVPDDSVSWEQIRDYRSDPESKQKFKALRRWITSFAKVDSSVQDAEEEIEYLVDQYRKHLRAHKLRTIVARFGIIATAGAAIFDGKLNPLVAGGLTYILYKVDLFDRESKAPGCEVAYIIKSQSEFGAR